MKNKIFLFLLPLLTALWLFACYKDDSPPYVKPDPCPWPEITTQGLNTFGCKINGKEWVPCVDLYGSVVSLRPIDCTLRESDGSNFLSMALTYSVQESDNDTLESLIVGLKPLKLGYNPISDLVYSSLDFGQIFESGQSSKAWENIDHNAQNYFEITRLDTSQNIISGVFKFTLLSENKQDTLQFTDGRFDLKYYPQ
ncbi:MAG: hypothetical protein KF734_01135 [Saprospiraceae bacterium]|nr:hypothetical protein [Saprospiraceae bacterium]